MKTYYKNFAVDKGWFIELFPEQGKRAQVFGPWEEMPVILDYWTEKYVDHYIIESPVGKNFISYYITSTPTKEYGVETNWDRRPDQRVYTTEHGRWAYHKKISFGTLLKGLFK